MLRGLVRALTAIADAHVPSAAQTGLLIAASEAPRTFSPSLLPRTAVGQGVVTGLAVTSSYLATVVVQEASRAAARRTVDALASGPRGGRVAHRAAALAADIALVPVGVAVSYLLPAGPRNPAWADVGRAAARRVATTGAAGAVLTASHAAWTALSDAIGPLPRGRRLADFPIAIPLGFATSLAADMRRRRRDSAGSAAPASRSDPQSPASPDPRADSSAPPLPLLAQPSTVPPDTPAWTALETLRASGVAAGIVATITAAATGESTLVRVTANALHNRLRGDERLWQWLLRAASVVGVTTATGALWERAVRRVESGTLRRESAIERYADRGELPAHCSGGPDSLVPWATLGREGRRHIAAAVAPRGAARHMPADLSIEAVMGSVAAEPVQVYVGLDSAPTVRERVDLALAEMERLGALDRSLLVLVSPTGTGYVNYVAQAALQYLTHGDVATVTMQYSRRPSMMAMPQRHAAREQNRRLWLELVARLHGRAHRPRLVIFGESLGALTSQEVFRDWGTLGPQALGFERALWLGTPAASEWRQQVGDPQRLDVDPDVVGQFNDFAQMCAIDPQRRASMRFVMLSHDNDAVTTFGLRLFVARPAWLDPARAVERATTPPGASPRGLPAGMRWMPGTTYYQNLVDMIAAGRDRGFRAYAHDYRGDLVDFLNETFALGASDHDLAQVRAAVIRREEIRMQALAGEA